MDDDLDAAIGAALLRDREVCARYARRFSWTESTRQFAAALVPVRGEEAAVGWPAPAALAREAAF
jgi:hypothetical protein